MSPDWSAAAWRNSRAKEQQDPLDHRWSKLKKKASVTHIMLQDSMSKKKWPFLHMFIKTWSQIMWNHVKTNLYGYFLSPTSLSFAKKHACLHCIQWLTHRHWGQTVSSTRQEAHEGLQGLFWGGIFIATVLGSKIDIPPTKAVIKCN